MTDSVGDLKYHLHETWHLGPLDRILLYWYHEEMNDARTLQQYGVWEGSYITLALLDVDSSDSDV